MMLVMKVEKAPLELYADIGGLDEAVELLNYIMVGENKSKEGKPPRLDLGYKGIVPMNMGTREGGRRTTPRKSQ